MVKLSWSIASLTRGFSSLGRALIRKARRVPGVVAVRDRLSYPDVAPVVAGPVF